MWNNQAPNDPMRGQQPGNQGQQSLLPGMNLTREQQQQILQNLQLRSLQSNPSLPQRDSLPQLPSNQQLVGQLSSQQISRSLANLPSFPQSNPAAALSLITQQQPQIQYQQQNSNIGNQSMNSNLPSSFPPSQFLPSNGQSQSNFAPQPTANFQPNQQNQPGNMNHNAFVASNILGMGQNPQIAALSNLPTTVNPSAIMGLNQQMNPQQQQLLLQQARQQLLSQPNQVAALKQRILQSNMAANSPLMNQQQNQQLQQQLLTRNAQDLGALPGAINSSAQQSQLQAMQQQNQAIQQQNQVMLPPSQFIGKGASVFPGNLSQNFDPAKFQTPLAYKQSPLPQATTNFTHTLNQTMTPSLSTESSNVLHRNSVNEQAPDAMRRKSSVDQMAGKQSSTSANMPSNPVKDEKPSVPTTSFHALLPSDAAFLEKLEAMSSDEVSSASAKMNQLVTGSREAIYRHHFKAHVDRCHAIMRDYQNLMQIFTHKNNLAASIPKRNAIDVISKRRRFHVPEKEAKTLFEQSECLAPIRIDVEHDGFKVRDAFLWNANDTLSINDFAETLCEDLKIPDQVRTHLFNAVVKSLKEQIEDFVTYGGKQMFTTPEGRGVLPEKDGSTSPVPATNEEEKDVRVLIKLDITVGTKSLIDQFEWDIYCKENQPEVFAHIMVQELGLSKEFETAIAHQIREQVHMYGKSLMLIDGQTNSRLNRMDDVELSSSLLGTVKSTSEMKEGIPAIRHVSEKQFYGPFIQDMAWEELDRIERDRERETRRKRRQTQRSRRSVALPEREALKTCRTPIPLTQPVFEESPVVQSDDEDYSMPTKRSRSPVKGERRKGGHLDDVIFAQKKPVALLTDIPKQKIQADVQQTLLGRISKKNSSTTIQSLDASINDDLDESLVAAADKPIPPEWIQRAVYEMRQRYPDDLFEVVYRKQNEQWKVKCFDCPGRLYAVGPDETLENLEIHLRNRVHRSSVAGRVEESY